MKSIILDIFEFFNYDFGLINDGNRLKDNEPNLVCKTIFILKDYFKFYDSEICEKINKHRTTIIYFYNKQNGLFKLFEKERNEIYTIVEHLKNKGYEI